MPRKSVKPRGGPSVRDFLRYYLLVLLQKKPTSAQNIRRTIRRQSRQNRDYRPSGPLLVEKRDLQLTIGHLARAGLIERAGENWRITPAGRQKLDLYDKGKGKHQNGKDRAARKLLKLLGEAAPGESVLDVGTGEGFLAFQVADKGYRVLGIDSGAFDYSKDSIRSAIQNAASRGARVEFRQSSVAELADQAPGSFDYVVSSQAVHCMSDQRETLEAICRLLKPGGAFLCMDFLVGALGFMHHGWHCFLAISREEWCELLPQCGFLDPACYRVADYLVVRARK